MRGSTFCESKCFSDIDCSGSKKCCADVCGSYCVFPTDSDIIGSTILGGSLIGGNVVTGTHTVINGADVKNTEKPLVSQFDHFASKGFPKFTGGEDIISMPVISGSTLSSSSLPTDMIPRDSGRESDVIGTNILGRQISNLGGVSEIDARPMGTNIPSTSLGRQIYSMGDISASNFGNIYTT